MTGKMIGVVCLAMMALTMILLITGCIHADIGNMR